MENVRHYYARLTVERLSSQAVPLTYTYTYVIHMPVYNGQNSVLQAAEFQHACRVSAPCQRHATCGAVALQ